MDNIETNNKSTDTSNPININSNENINKTKEKRNNRYLEIGFLTCVSGASILFGFSSALAIAKKKDSNAFDKGVSIVKTVATESGGSLAMRALLWGSIYACTGFGLFCFSVWKAMGVNDLKEFRQKVGNFLPRIPRNDSPNSRTEFSSLKDLLEYIIEESDKSKNNKSDKK